MCEVKVTKEKMTIPTYIPKKANDLPMFFENKPYQGASGRVYPIPYADGISDEKTAVDYTAYTLENEYIRTVLLPEIGGKVLRAYDKVGKYDFIYYNEVIKPALVGLAGPWISGGIEFNWPQHHRPTTFLPVEAAIEENADGKTVWMGEVEPMNRMKGMVGITVDAGRSYIQAKVRLYNRTALPQVFMWWANLAAPGNNAYRTVFPPDCEWVNDHDRRAVLSWPVAKGVYHTARPYDFGDGTDLSRYDAVKVPSSYLISQGQSDMNFVSGYDTALQKGMATVANHYIAPGKKMWHWGVGDFGDMWCSNLTDKNGPYIELMTGVYTDNQPDFTWIAPYETKEFVQYWYPIRGIGEIKNATADAAVNVEKRKDGLFIGLNVTGTFAGATVRVVAADTVLYSEAVTLTPETVYTRTVPLGDVQPETVTVSLIATDGKTLVQYCPPRRGKKQPIPVRHPVRRPQEYATVEELFINGYHLEQYKQHNYRPQDYYLEGLRRDPGDSRCNTGMARLSLKSGDFRQCLTYADAAIVRLTDRNQHPTNTEAFYLKGLALEYLGRYHDAYDILYRAAWNYSHRSAAYLALACLDCRNGAFADALEKLDISLGLNRGHTVAQNLKTALLRRLDPAAAKKAAAAQIADDRLDLFALVEYARVSGDTVRLQPFTAKPENFLNVANVYMRAGMYEDALFALSFADGHYPLTLYYRAFCTAKCGKNADALLLAAENTDTGYCFPAALEDIAVLQFATEANPAGGNAHYYLGCLLYDRCRYAAAAACFEQCVALCPQHGKAWRNLALYAFDVAKQPEKARACMEKALEYKPDDPRLLLEYQQLLKNSNVPPAERLAVYDRYPALLSERDDCYLDKLTLLSEQGKYQEAITMAAAKRFHIYEGGEGKLTRQHAWMHVLYGNALAAAGDTAAAQRVYLAGASMPKSYGEAKTFFNQEAHIYYFLAKLYARAGKQTEARGALETAAVYKAAVSEISLFRALALRELGKPSEAAAVLAEMTAVAEERIKNTDLRSYYGVGSPSPMPFENDIEKSNLLDGHILAAFACLGMGETQKADAHIAAAAEKDPYDFRIYTYGEIKKALL